jgi:hypothetical protein
VKEKKVGVREESCWAQWLTAIILATWELEKKRIEV